MQSGDTLRKIAAAQLGSERRWRELASINHLSPPYTLLIGQRLELPQLPGFRPSATRAPVHPTLDLDLSTDDDVGAAWAVGRGFFFVLADEILPSGKVVRRVIEIPKDRYFPPDELRRLHRLARPDLFGMEPPVPNSSITMAEHVGGMNQSRFLSASTLDRGAPNIQGKPFWLDVKKLKESGAVIHSTEDILRDIDRHIAENPHQAHQYERLKHAIANVEGEVLVEGKVPKQAVKSGAAMAATKGLRFVQYIGIVLTAYDFGVATVQSVEEQSALPVTAEAIRQAGGWGGFAAGAKIGGAVGVALGIELGPGAIIIGAAGGLIFGAIGYFSFDLIADWVYEN